MPPDTGSLEDRAEKIQSSQEHLKRAMVAHDYKLDALLEHFLKAMTVIYQLKLSAEGAKRDARRRETSIDEISHRLMVIEKNICGKRQKRSAS